MHVNFFKYRDFYCGKPFPAYPRNQVDRYCRLVASSTGLTAEAKGFGALGQFSSLGSSQVSHPAKVGAPSRALKETCMTFIPPTYKPELDPHPGKKDRPIDLPGSGPEYTKGVQPTPPREPSRATGLHGDELRTETASGNKPGEDVPKKGTPPDPKPVQKSGDIQKSWQKSQPTSPRK
jgi:hypothetical protein